MAPSITKTSKAKTKAKARYLKRKKLRRKARKSSAPRNPGDAPQTSSGSEEDGEHHDDENGVVHEVDGDGTSEERLIATEQPVQPPKKRRRVVGEGPDSYVGAPGEIHDSENKELPGIRRPLAIPTGTLPSFPLPTAPVAPPKSVLAMQGIDKALIHAKVINPDAVTPLSIAEQDHDSGLSLKTRRRLLDLGISELFAGQGLITRAPASSADDMSCSTDHSFAFPHPPQSVAVYTVLYSSGCVCFRANGERENACICPSYT